MGTRDILKLEMLPCTHCGVRQMCVGGSHEKDMVKYWFTEKLGDLVWWETTLVLVRVA